MCRRGHVPTRDGFKCSDFDPNLSTENGGKVVQFPAPVCVEQNCQFMLPQVIKKAMIVNGQLMHVPVVYCMKLGCFAGSAFDPVVECGEYVPMPEAISEDPEQPAAHQEAPELPNG